MVHLCEQCHFILEHPFELGETDNFDFMTLDYFNCVVSLGNFVLSQFHSTQKRINIQSAYLLREVASTQCLKQLVVAYAGFALNLLSDFFVAFFAWQIELSVTAAGVSRVDICVAEQLRACVIFTAVLLHYFKL